MFFGIFLSLYHPRSYVNWGGIYGGPKSYLSVRMRNHFNFACGGAVFFFFSFSFGSFNMPTSHEQTCIRVGPVSQTAYKLYVV